MEIEVKDKSGALTGKKVNLPESVFGVEPNDHAIYLDVKQYLAQQRQGTHKSKERAEIAGSTKKIKKQKGTGTARAGSIKSPVFRGGGRVFGPRPRNYDFKLNKKLKKVARRSALSYKASDSSISVLENFSMDNPKTKDFASLIKGLELEGKKTLFVLGENNKNVFLSSRNIQKANVTTVDSLNTYDIVNADNLIVFEDSIEKLSNI
ncbi:50S ribosomal protein L4 [Flexithrix dorotheae]|uniref:50S ribosomal protein L4 n=1 Tax=Flexithrix dorotheae TaxID=70993 RepID=UPI000370663E|nr:50S ribosomal protein L4 [Flexithrix dorotheae]